MTDQPQVDTVRTRALTQSIEQAKKENKGQPLNVSQRSKVRLETLLMIHGVIQVNTILSETRPTMETYEEMAKEIRVLASLGIDLM